MTKALPEGYHTVTPFLNVKGAPATIEFMKRAFAAEERGRMADPNGAIMHAEVKIGDSIIMLSEAQHRPAMTGALHLYVTDADAVFKAAVDAGARVVMPLQNMFWGDRYGMVVDPQGNQWSIATHVEDVPMEEMRKRPQAAMSNRPPA